MKPIKIFLTNLGKYNEGELVGKWVPLPITRKALNEAMKEIGIGSKDEFGQPYEEWFISDYDCDISDLAKGLGEHENLNELNYLAAKIEDLCEFEKETFEAVMEYDCGAGIVSAAEIINIIENLDCFILYPNVDDDYDLGCYWIEESGCYDLDKLGNLRNYIDYEAFGRDYSFETEGGFVGSGFLEVIDSTTTVYDGPDDIPDEYIILGNNEEDEEE